MPKRAREFVTGHLVGLPPAVIMNVVLLTSELVTNVVVHGDTPAYLQLLVTEGSVRVLAHDSGAGAPVIPPTNPAELQSNGRGLVLVAALSRSWGVEQSTVAPGKDVWFDIEFSRTAAAARG